MHKILFVNGMVTTLDPALPTAEAVYAENGRIQGVGTSEELRLQFGRADVQTVDLEGGFVCPGLVDSHLHLMGHGMKLSMLDFSDTSSKEELLERVRVRAAETPAGEWIRGFNWDENRWPVKEPPTLEELDAAAPLHPVMLTRVCHHVQVVNGMALHKAGISRETPDPPGGLWGRDASGELNGLVFENASRPLYDAMPPFSDSDRKEWARRGMEDALSKGLTGVHTEDLRSVESVSRTMEIFRQGVEEGRCLRTHHLIYHPYLQECIDLGIAAGDGDEWLRVGAVKIFADGSIGGRTALLSRPYADDPSTRGMAIHTEEELKELVGQAREAGMPVAVHAIGDEAAERVIAALEAHPLKGVELPDRLIHGQVLRRDLVDRLSRMRLAVDIQPRFVASDFPWVMERLGPERLEFAYAWRTLLEAGIPCAGGSDAPIEPIDPLLGMHAAITRRLPDDPNGKGYGPRQKLTPLQTLQLFTVGSAMAAGEERERGTLTVGKYADLSVFDRDLLRCDPDELLKAKVRMTVVNGRIAYRG